MRWWESSIARTMELLEVKISAISEPSLRKFLSLNSRFLTKEVEFARRSVAIHLIIPTLLITLQDPARNFLFDLLNAAHIFILTRLTKLRKVLIAGEQIGSLAIRTTIILKSHPS
jgi:hypothetical protein